MTNYFAKNLKYLRKKKNIDQQTMAKDLGIAQSTLSCWESGIRTPDLDMIVKINKYLNIGANFITEDLTNIDNTNDLTMLFNNNKHLLTQEDQQQIKSIIEKRINKNNNK